MLAYLSGSVDQELLLQNEHLVTENRILKNQIKGRLRLTDPERINLAEIGGRLGRKALEEVAQIVRPETILGWHRKLIAMKFDGSKDRSPVGRAPTAAAIEDLVLQFARANRSWGYRRIVGATSNLGYEVSHQTVANILKRHDLAPAPERGKRILLAGVHPLASRNVGGRVFLHSGGLDGWRIDDLLCAGVYEDCIAPDQHRRYHAGS